MINATNKEGIRYLEHCKIVVNDNRLSIIKKEDSIEKYYSIPYFNLCVLLLGEGTSITQKAAKFLSSEGVMLGFTGSGGSPLFLASQNEYRPTHYFNKFIDIWSNPESKLELARSFQKERVTYVINSWNKIYNNRFNDILIEFGQKYIDDIQTAKDQNKILLAEAMYTKKLYKILKNNYEIGFKREHRKRDDKYNSNLDDGNYLAYGLASIVLWTLGIPASMSILHGKTRNGGLVFDIADIIKDGVILPHAFIGADYLQSSTEQRKLFIDKLDEFKSLEFIFSVLQKLIMEK